ncbi:MAG: NAD-dependent deacylase [Saprospiraceae bacterium]
MKIVMLTGAGISAESGLKTFRDAGGLWEGHAIEDVATPQAFERNPDLVLEFYNQRRRQLLEVQPNGAHRAITELAKRHEVKVVTQNVDDLHERAGNNSVLHLHGELLSVRSTGYPSLKYRWNKDLIIGDLCSRGHQLRPDIVWFGEAVPLMDQATDWVEEADVVIIVGTSMLVYPAAGLIYSASSNVPIYYIDPNPGNISGFSRRRSITTIKENAQRGMEKILEILM